MSTRLSIWLITGMFFISLSLWGCGGGGGSSSAPSTVSQKNTVLVYMVGSDLESGNGFATNNIGQMMQVGSTNNLNIVIETGGANKTGWTTVKRQMVQPGSVQPLQDLGTIDMADPATLQDFIVWAQTNFPADKYHLILWDHGGGAIGGFGADENFGNKTMLLPQIFQAISEAHAMTGKSFETIGFDACLMATIEVANGLSPYSKYLIASEEIEPGAGWDYTAILSAINSNPAIDGASLGKVIADSFKSQITSQSPDDAKVITLSVTDLSKVTSVTAALDALSERVQTNLAAEDINNKPTWLAVSKARSKTESYGNNPANYDFKDMGDLGQLGALLQSSFPAEADALSTSLNQAIVYEIKGIGRPNATGLSVYFPFRMPYDSGYDAINFSPVYKSMIASYVALQVQDTVAPTFTNFSSTETSMSATVVGDDIDSVEVIVTTSDPAGGTVIILGLDTITPDVSGNVNFTWYGQWLLMNDNFISFFDIGVEGNITIYDIPVFLNGSLADILVVYDSNTGDYSIIGAWPGILSSGVAERDILPINPGDVITPLFLSYDLATDQLALVQGNPFTVPSGGPSLSLAPLPTGTYEAAFLATDYAQNDNESPFASFQVPVTPPNLDTWTTKAPMPTARGEFATGVINNILYVAGGLGSSGTYDSSVEAYNYSVDAWTSKAPMPTAREAPAAGVVNNILYVVGGWNGGPLATVEAYNPNNDTWTTKAPMPTARYGLAVGVINNVLYAVGGCCDSNGALATTVEAYDPNTDTWTTKAPMPTARLFLSAGVVNNVLYAMGGFNRSGILTFPTVEAYDPTTNTWTTKAPMPTGRGGLAIGVINNILYTVGGWNSNGALTTVEAYNPNTDTWTTKAPMPTARFYLSAGVVNNILYAVGGGNDSGVRLATVEAFTPS